MNADTKRRLEEQVALLKDLRNVLDQEKASLSRWDPRLLKETTLRKEQITGGLSRLAGAAPVRTGARHEEAARDPDAARLVRVRDGLARELQERALTQKRVFEEHAERVAQTIRFLQHVHAPGNLYDAQGRLR